MNLKDRNNLATKTVQDRYARIFGTDWKPHPPSIQKTKRNFLLWIPGFLIFLVLLLVIGTRYLINIQAESTEEIIVSTKSDTQRKQDIFSISELPPLSGDPLPVSNILISEQIDTNDAEEFVDQEKLQGIENHNISFDSKKKFEPVDPDQFLVIVHSTKSKNDAIKQAKELAANGYPGEVILSSSGYYGVVLGRYSFDDAKKAMKAVVVSGNVTKKPYLMGSDRIKEYVYPVADSPLSE